MPRHNEDEDDLYTPFGALPLEEEPEEDEAEPADEDDDFADLDDDTRERVQQAIKQGTHKYKTSVGGRIGGVLRNLRQAGFDIDEDGLDVRNPQRLTRFLQEKLGYTPEAPAARAAEAEPEEKTPALPELPDEIPDQFSDPKGFRDYMKLVAQHAASGHQAELQAARREIEELRASLGDSTFGNIVDLAQDVLPEYGLEHLLDHPDFARVMKDTFQKLNIPQKSWTDPDMIARVAGVANVDLRKSTRKPSGKDPLADFQEQPRNRRERREQEAPATPRNVVNRSGRTQIGASGGSERPAGGGFDQNTRNMAQRLGMRPEEVAALRESTPDAYNKVRSRGRK